MPVIRLRRDFWRFYLLLVLSFCLFMGMSIGTGLFFLHILKTGTFTFKDYFLPVFSLLTLFMAFFTVARFIGLTPSITVEGDTIRVGKKRYLLSDIEQVYILGKVRFPYIIDHLMLGGTLVFKNGDKRNFYQELYRDGWKLKYFLDQVIIKKQPYTEPGASSKYAHALIEPGVEYKGSLFTSIRSLLAMYFIGLLCFGLVKYADRIKLSLLLFSSPGIICWLLMLIYTVYYFEVTDEFFIVRNPIFFWKKHIYKLDEIDRVYFETRYKLPNGLRVVSNDYRTKLYWAATLNRKTWLAMKQLLEEKGVRVHNECIDEHGLFEKLDV